MASGRKVVGSQGSQLPNILARFLHAENHSRPRDLLDLHIGISWCSWLRVSGPLLALTAQNLLNTFLDSQGGGEVQTTRTMGHNLNPQNAKVRNHMNSESSTHKPETPFTRVLICASQSLVSLPLQLIEALGRGCNFCRPSGNMA